MNNSHGNAFFPGSRFVLLLVVPVVLGAVLFTGCAGGRRLGGSSLSEAVEEARDDRRDRDDEKRRDGKRKQERRRVLHAGQPIPEPPVVLVRRHPGRRPRGRPDRPRDEETTRFNVGVATGRTTFGRRELDRARFLALHVGAALSDVRQRVELGVDLAGAGIDVQPGLDRSLRNVGELSLGFTARYYTAPPATGAAFYGMAGFDLGALWWDYASPVLIEDDYEIREIDGDWMGTYSPYVGMGFCLLQRHGMRFGANFAAGYKFFDRHTSKGLYNDLFDPAPFVQVRFDLGHSIH